MSAFFRSREVMLIIMGISFLIVFIPYFFNIPALESFSTTWITIAAIISAFTLVLAVYSQFRRGIYFIRTRRRAWGFKVWMMAGIILMIVFAMMGMERGPYSWVMYAVITPLSSVNYGILAFYLSSTCARAFRARNLRALALLISGFIVLFYQAPLTGAFIPGIEPVARYFTETFAMAFARIFAISVTLGAIVFGIRVLLGKEPMVLGFAREES